MYQRLGYGDLGALPRQLTPPRWLRKELTRRAGAMLRGTRVEIPTGSGTEAFDLSDPAALARLKAMFLGARIRGPEGEGASSEPGNVPGGWLTIAGVALGIYLLTRRG